MKLEELKKLVAKGESESLEFKKTTGQRTEAAKTICALLNGLGGCLLFGVSDRGDLTGQQVTAKTLEDITLELRRIEPPAFPDIETVAIGGEKSVIVIRVASKVGTYCYDGRPYIRHGPITQIMPRTEYEKRILDKLHAHRRWENELAPDWVTIEDLDEEEIQFYPSLATREAVANAVCHRDYITHGGAVAIAMYDDRLEIINSGILHFDITPEKLTKPHESKPWNPIIASVFYRAGVIEKWGMGTLNIIEWCKKNGNPKPIWEIRAQSVVTTFSPSSFFSTGKSLERPESGPESLEGQVLILLEKGPLSKSKISRALGHRNISGGLKKVLSSLLNQGKIVYTIPEKPNSRLQKYKLN